jgi:hypothetical protein
MLVEMGFQHLIYRFARADCLRETINQVTARVQYGL